MLADLEKQESGIVLRLDASSMETGLSLDLRENHIDFLGADLHQELLQSLNPELLALTVLSLDKAIRVEEQPVTRLKIYLDGLVLTSGQETEGTSRGDQSLGPVICSQQKL